MTAAGDRAGSTNATSTTGSGGRGRRPRGSAAERRAQILTAARTLFAERGFHATTTRELAASADLNDALLYRHFASKEEILAGLMDQAVAVFQALPELPVPPPGAEPELPLEVLLRFVGEGFVRVARANLDLLTIMISEHRSLAEDTRFVEFVDRAATELGALIDGHRGGQGEPAGAGEGAGDATGYLTARTFFGSLISFLLLQDVLGLDRIRPLDPADYVRELARTAAGRASV
ncbi:TetR/AcrR family transcriptional regulator [Kitasatospora kifunensis]|uniref:AcrR family transcriptional regulator n=1 Tax=Kitasatospora kifunensis TaxID=58351 RepID=A0A7W7R6D0_KITKI|nr:TetR/AcrR family transcriptional regulator [Kitasatospora kifunensis]MBB4926196.1 AcrR family transcriptional regulator [Kitasatospora kifunensis]